MDCFVCCESFNLSNRVPLLICCEGHTCCSECSESLNQCPLCRKFGNYDQSFLIEENESLKTKVDELSDEVLNLKRENSALFNQIQSISTLNNELHDKGKSYNQQILNLETDNHLLRDENERLKSQILKFNSHNNENSHKAIAPSCSGSSQGLIPKPKKKLQQEIPVKREVKSNYEIDLSKLKPRLREVLEEMRNGSVSEVRLTNDPWNSKNEHIGNDGAIALADALKVNSTVTKINLECNSIGTEGAIALADALKVNSTVTKISLSSNSIDSETKELIKRISNNRIIC
ncbi:hypothetical protein GEMRC1_012851 [Eukaryota sp. GEM-RC1]